MQVRVVRDGGEVGDWSLAVSPGATVGHLAGALGAPAGTTIAIDGAVLPDSVALATTSLASGSEVRIGAVEEDHADHRPGEALHLATVTGPDAGRRIAVAATGTDVGRAPGRGFVDDPAMSRRHLHVAPCDAAGGAPGAVVRDLGSTNGTWHDGRRVDAPVTVACGDVVRAGLSTLRVERVAERDDRPPGVHHRPPRQPAPPEPPALVPPATPAEAERPRLAVATLAVPLATGAALALLYGPHLAVIAIIGPVITLGGWLAARHVANRAARRDRRAHEDALAQLLADATARRDDEEANRRRAQPDLLELVDRAVRRDPRVWERRRHHDDFLQLTVGPGDLPWSPPTSSAPDAAAREVLDRVSLLRDVPVVVDAHTLTGIV
ncbi:MAG TPA: FHA domain-containing protein, partial [Acidimicrobiales bacterium]